MPDNHPASQCFLQTLVNIKNSHVSLTHEDDPKFHMKNYPHTYDHMFSHATLEIHEKSLPTIHPCQKFGSQHWKYLPCQYSHQKWMRYQDETKKFDE